MPEHDSTTEQQDTTQDATRDTVSEESPAAPVAKTARKRQTKRATAAPVFDTGAGDAQAATAEAVVAGSSPPPGSSAAPAFVAPEVVEPAPRRRTSDTGSGDTDTGGTSSSGAGDTEDTGNTSSKDSSSRDTSSRDSSSKDSSSRQTGGTGAKPKPSGESSSSDGSDDTTSGDDAHADTSDTESDSDQSASRRRRRRRGGRGRRRGPEDSTTDEETSGGERQADDASDDDGAATSDTGNAGNAGNTTKTSQTSKSNKSTKSNKGANGAKTASTDTTEDASDEASETHADSDGNGDSDGDGDTNGGSRRRRRRRRRTDGSDGDSDDTSAGTGADEVTSVKGSTRVEAKKQRRREGREAGRRRPPIVTESEFLARRESVERVMAVRQQHDLTQVAVLEDDVLVEHYASRASSQSLIGNVYLGRVQNVLPSMEAAFIDIGKGRNAVLYAGEVDWEALGKADGPKRIEEALKSGQSVLVQVTKDPAGHKGARLSGQISIPGRFVVYVPGGSMSGISRKLPDTERSRLKRILKQVVPDDAGVIVRTAAEGASEEDLTADVTQLRTIWESIQKKYSGSSPQVLHREPELATRVVRDLFNEDFSKLVVSGKRAWDEIGEYVRSVASSLADRVQPAEPDDDVFSSMRIDEQVAKALERKVWLPSGGSLIIDRTEAMTVVDVNTGKFTGSGGNLEETVTRNNLEAAEEIVRQLRLRDIGGMIVIDFIDMVLEANRDLVLRRLVECLGRDRTRHQVAEVTSLVLVQMARKRIGTGLLEASSEPCAECKARGVLLHDHPLGQGDGHTGGEGSGSSDSDRSRGERRGRRRRGGGGGGESQSAGASKTSESSVRKLESNAAPELASPADLRPVTDPDTKDPDTKDPEATEADSTGADATDRTPADKTPTDGAPPQDEGDEPTSSQTSTAAVPPRRRRRAQRPAGGPESRTVPSGPAPETESSPV